MATYSQSTNANGESRGVTPDITLYTNHNCPFAHRAHIALKELDLPYNEVIIDLDKPREPWYLEINPRGLVPSIKYSNGLLKDEIITESAIVAQFLADSRPSGLLPPSLKDPYSPLVRARIAFFTDTWNSKVQTHMYPMLKADGEEKEKIAKTALEAIEKDIEPLLKDAKPFFGGSSEVTMAEVITAPFVLRFYANANGELMPKSFKEGMQKLPNFSKWADALRTKESIMYVFNEEELVERAKKRIAKMKADAAK